MSNERTDKTDIYRFRRVKWGNPRHQMNKLRNAMPAIAEGDREPAGRWFWVAVFLLLAFTLFNIYLIVTGTQLF